LDLLSEFRKFGDGPEIKSKGFKFATVSVQKAVDSLGSDKAKTMWTGQLQLWTVRQYLI